MYVVVQKPGLQGHRVRDLTDFDTRSLGLLAAATADRAVACLSHRHEAVRYFCFTCNIPICRECTTERHTRPGHQYDAIQEIAEKQLDAMHSLLADARSKRVAVSGLGKLVEGASGRLRAAHAQAHAAVAENAQLLISLIEEQRNVAFKELENTHGTKQVSLALLEKKLAETGERLEQTVEFMARLLAHASGTEALVFKQLLETRLAAYLAQPTDVAALSAITELAYVPNTPTQMRQAVTGIFGYVRTGDKSAPTSEPATPGATAPTGPIAPSRPMPTPIGLGRPPSRSRFISLNLGPSNGGSGVLSPGGPLSSSLGDSGLGVESPPFSDSLNPVGPPGGLKTSAFGGSNQSLGPFPTFTDAGVTGPAGLGNGAPLYEKWSTSGSEGLGQHITGLNISTQDPHHPASFQQSPDSLLDLNPPVPRGMGIGGVGHGGAGGGSSLLGLFPPRSQIKRQKMIYHCKFGEFGVLEAQFTEPSGVAVNGQSDIIVADTNNHRIQVFDREGRFKFQFGECGKRDGQLLYPNRVAVNRATGDIIVTERSPTHQIQIYNQYGQFLRKFGANVLQHPRGVTVDSKGRIVVIECKVMRVLIFDMGGSILQKFSCSRYLEFPNGVCTNDRQEIFISDNRAHSVKVFSYEGTFLRQLGGEGITNYPIGVGINPHGEVVVADNHNNFNLTLFSQDGQLLSALESKVKHAQCFDVALLDEGSVVLASKDYRLYLYRYAQAPTFPL